MATAIPSNRALFSLGEIARVTGGALHGALDVQCTGVTTDTRGELQGRLFVALKGASFDAHTFLASAIAAGASAVLSEQPLPVGVPGVVVADTLVALGALAQTHRQRWGGQIVAVAGSAGKTTTKSVIAAMLRGLLGPKLHIAAGNLNNRIGVPMVLLGLQAEHEAAVIEIGTNRTGEVATLTRMSRPDISVLTLIDLEHTEGLGGIDAIAIEEGAIFAEAPRLAVGNADDVRVLEQLRSSSAETKLGYGFSAAADYRITSATLTSRCTMTASLTRPDGSALQFETPWLGEPGVLSTTAAIAVAEAVAARPLERQIVEQALNQAGHRETGRLLPLPLLDGSLVIDDSYNANPASVRAALHVARQVADLRGARLHVVLGEMRELGSWSALEHERLLEDIARAKPSRVTAICGAARCWAEADGPGLREFFTDSRAAARAVSEQVEAGDVVLVKASRGVRAELVVQALVAARGYRS